MMAVANGREMGEKCLSQAVTIGSISLAGGQGKTTISLFLGIKLVRLGYRVCFVDCDPQASLSFNFDPSGWAGRYTVLEVLKNQVPTEQAVYPCLNGKAGLIAADNSLGTINSFLAESGNCANLLKRKLKAIQENYDVIIIDTPPSQSQIGLCGIGACQISLIPVEITPKGAKGLLDTLQALYNYEEYGAFTGKILGIIPFRERWFGQNMATESRNSKSVITTIATKAKITLLPSLVESEICKKAVISCCLPGDYGNEELNHSINKLTEELLSFVNSQ